MTNLSEPPLEDRRSHVWDRILMAATFRLLMGLLASGVVDHTYRSLTASAAVIFRAQSPLFFDGPVQLYIDTFAKNTK